MWVGWRHDASEVMANLDDWLTIGRIVAPQGLNGELRVYPMSDFPERFLEPGERWLLRSQGTEPEPIQLLSGRFIGGKGLYVLELEGIRYRDQAERLRDAMLLVPASDRPVLEDDEYHVMDLIGVQVVDHVTGELIGTIKDVIPAGNDLLEVELNQVPVMAVSQAPTPSGSADAAIATDPETPIPTTTHAVDKTISTPEDDSKKAAESTQFLRKKGRRSRTKHAKKKKRAAKVPTVLIPFVPEIVPVVDLDAGRIAIAPPPGLLDDLLD